MFSFIKRWWPFVWKKDYLRVIESYDAKIKENMELRKNLAIAEKEAEVAKSQAKELREMSVKFQGLFDQLMRDRYGQAYSTIGERVLRIVEDRPDIMIACLGKFKASFVDAFDPMKPVKVNAEHVCIRMERIRLMLEIHLGLGPDMPPEFIARDLAERAYREILAGWQKQSILNKL